MENNHCDVLNNINSLDAICATYLKSNLTKSFADYQCLQDYLTTLYQGLYCDYGFPGWISKDKDGNVFQSTQTDIEGLNGEQAWILVSYGKTRMLRKKCFKDDIFKGIFVSYVLHTDQLILYNNCETERVKITSHYKFDEGFNKVPTESVPLGFQ